MPSFKVISDKLTYGILWFVTPDPDDRGNTFLRNLGNHLQDFVRFRFSRVHTVSQPNKITINIFNILRTSNFKFNVVGICVG
jgi:hypothetical protein